LVKHILLLLVDGLKHNLLSISQLCDKSYNVIFKSIMCIIVNEIDNQVLFVAFRNENVYTIDLDNMTSKESICLAAINENSWLWHRRLGHVNKELLSKLSKLDLVKGLPVTKFVKDKICDACQLGKQTKSSFKKKKVISTSRPLELLHMDLFGPIRTASLSGKLYAFVIVDDYSRYTWVLFLTHKNEAHKAFVKHCRRIQNEKGFTRGKLNITLFLMFDGKDMLIVQIYVDDIIFGSTNENLCKEFSKTMQDEFEMSMMGELKFFLGLQIKQTEEGIFLNQSKYVIDLLKRFGLTNVKAYGTPMSPSTKLDKDEKGKPVDVKLYRGMIGSLLYLTASRPDIMFSVCLCARFQSCPKESHLIAVKRIFRYLLGTIDLGLWYPKSNSFDLISYTDADFSGCKIDRKSTSGTCHFLGHSLVSWFSKKQNSVALSTAEAEYVAAGSCCAQSLYIKQQLEDFKIIFDHIPIRCDNTSAISLSKNPIQHSRTKHIEIRYHFIRDHVQKGDIELEFVSTDSQWADILTKPLIEERFCTIRREIGMARYVDIK
jgi:hypothetical protein